MTIEQKGEEDQQTQNSPAVGYRGMVEEHYRKIKEHAETYPYVWASYIVVYGGFSLWTAYRWRKLRKTEERVRALQLRLSKLVEAEETSGAAPSVQKATPSTNTSARTVDSGSASLNGSATSVGKAASSAD
ncbi:hypothetical protein CFOL_v3_29014 [Cephalotus follicularis]|uniref:Transmembrane protein n=1 Tax=Cephalotus follicularis TaxID=3775 RepID=A0A1Q3CZS1_CEPFO|nr:hypothetical protein CFOL_v3_29014 [Cephalotus follicularis]